MASWKLFVVVRPDLSNSQKAVQACHAVGEWCRKFPEWQNETLILLEASSLEHLLELERSLGTVPHVVFREPDIGNEATALATIHRLREFKKMKLA
jgi:hypothetical protein